MVTCTLVDHGTKAQYGPRTLVIEVTFGLPTMHNSTEVRLLSVGGRPVDSRNLASHRAQVRTELAAMMG